MAKKDVSYKELSTDELNERLLERKLQLRKYRFAHAVSALEQPNTLRVTRKEIARLLTELTHREKAATLKA